VGEIPKESEMTFSTNNVRDKMLEHNSEISKVVGGITFDSTSPIVSILEFGRGTWKDASFADSNVKGNAMQGSFPFFEDNEPAFYGAEGSAGASAEFNDVLDNPNKLGWKAFDQLAPSKKSWIVSTLLTMKDFEREEMLQAMKANCPLELKDVQAIVDFIYEVSKAYTRLLEHVGYVDEAIWEVKASTSKKSKSKSNKDKEKEFKEAFSSLGLLS
jgi:hypothetical protein